MSNAAAGLMEGEKGKELNMDCLVNVLGRVGIESLLIDVLFVCKSWYKATKSPLCWRQLDFLEISLDDCTSLFFLARLVDDYQVKGKFSFTSIVKTLVKRSATSAMYVSFPNSGFCDEEWLVTLAIFFDSPSVLTIVLELPADIDHDVVSKVPKLTSNWKCLEFLRFGTTFKMEEILSQISIHCKNFACFSASHADIKKDEATSIVTLVPNIVFGVKMEGRKWEELNMDCLVNVLGRVGIESLLLDIPFVCKSWCPNLRTFVLPYGLPYEHMLKIPNLINKWKSLEYLTLCASCFQLQEIIYQISIHCNNFVGLGVPNAYIGKSDASAIATLLPNIKELDLRCANIEKESLVMIFKGCKELEYVDVSDCEGFDEGDIDILKLASHIRTFKPEGSMLFDSDDDKEGDNDGFDLDLMFYCGYRSC
ncbi:F-box/LRR-repeat protein [Camellia lanceoleosa]|uniref:F-box/LRR-repeat protein n=1 Tax=Camellia lanceoleosa TaxID=1840588 RepID=A0ACC0GS91_9ERIC|nr:F-box/LRR-repeat protein [Camellia lanceoleosa]